MAQIVSNMTSRSSIATYLSVSATAERASSSTINITANWTIKTGNATSYNSTTRYLVLCNSSGSPLQYQNLGRTVWNKSSTYTGSVKFTGISASSSSTSMRITFKTSGSSSSLTTTAPLIFDGSATVSGGNPSLQYGNVTFSTGSTTTPSVTPKINAATAVYNNSNQFYIYANSTTACKVAVWSADEPNGPQLDLAWSNMTSGSWTVNGVSYNYRHLVDVNNYSAANFSHYQFACHVYTSDNSSMKVVNENGDKLVHMSKPLVFNAGVNGGRVEGGSVYTRYDVRCGQSYGTLPTATKDGATFNGWYTSSSGGSKLSTSTTMNTNVLSGTSYTYYAQFTNTSQTFTIKYYSDVGGTLNLSPSSYTVSGTSSGGYITLPNVPSRSGYKGSWSQRGTSNKYASGAQIWVYGNQIFDAVYTAQTSTFTITYYDANNNKVNLSPSSATTAAGGTSVTITLPTVPISSNLYTGQWAYGSKSGSRFNGGARVSISSNAIFYAIQTKTRNQIQFAGGAYASSGSATTLYKDVNSSISLPGASFTRTGYKQVGWSTDYYGSNLAYSLYGTYSSTNDAVLYPYWEVDYRLQTFNVTNGVASPSSQNVMYGATVLAPQVTPNKGYRADGSWNPSLPRTCDGTRTYTYTCSPQTYTCFFNANGGSCSTNSKVVTYNSTYGTLPTPTRAGYTFNGWYTYPTGGTRILSTSTFLMTSDITLYAQWTIQSGTLIFVDADTNTTITSYTLNYGTAVDVNVYKSYSSIRDKKIGHTIQDFYTTAACSVVQGNFTMSSGNKYIYVKYTPNVYTITYNVTSATGGSQASTTVYSNTVRYGDKYVFPPDSAITPSPGYELKGWYTSASNGTQLTTDTTYNVANNSTVYAQYQPKIYNLICDWNLEGKGSITKKQTFLGTYNIPTAAEGYAINPGYEVKGWYQDETGTKAIPSKYKTIGDEIIYAQWRGRLYSLTLDLNGGYYTGGSLPSISVRYNESVYGLPTAATLQKTDHTFAYWINVDTGQRINNGDVWKTPNGTTIRAIWKDQFSHNCVCIVEDGEWKLFVPNIFLGPNAAFSTYVFHNNKWRRVKPKYSNFPQEVK